MFMSFWLVAATRTIYCTKWFENECRQTDRPTVAFQPIARDDENAPLRGYTVQYRRAGTTLYAETTVAADSHQVALSGLLPWRYYAVRVLVVNAVGRGPASSEQTARTSAEGTTMLQESTSSVL